MSFPSYPAYKDSGVAWLGEVPAHWEIVPLKRLLEIQNGADHKHIEQDEGYPVIGSGGPFAYASDYLYDGESVLLGRKGTIDKPLYVTGKFWTVDTMYWSRLQPGTNGRFAYYAALTIPFSFYSTSTALPSMTKSVLGAHLVAFPTEAEQTAIATFLDRETTKIDALVAEQENLIGLLTEKRQAVISHAVTKGLDPSVPMKDSGVEWLGEVPEHWVVKPLGTLAHVIQTGPFGSQLHSDEYVEDATPVINPSNIIDGQLCPDPLSTVSDEVVARLAHHKLYAGDIVLGRRGEMGRCAFVNQTQTGWLCGTGCLKIRLSSGGLPEFVCHYLATETIKQYLSLQSVGSTMENLNTQILSRVPIPVPDVTEQAEICEALTEQLEVLDALTSEAVIGVQLLQERRTALISAAVTGQIDVRALI